MVRKKGNSRLVEAHDAYWASEAEMEEGNPQLILNAAKRRRRCRRPSSCRVWPTTMSPPTWPTASPPPIAPAAASLDLHKFEGQPHTFIPRDPASDASRRATELLRDFVLKQAKTI